MDSHNKIKDHIQDFGSSETGRMHRFQHRFSKHGNIVTIGQCISICMGHSGGDRYFICYGPQ